MAPRVPKPNAEDGTGTSTSTPEVLKPKTEKSKVVKPKAEKGDKSAKAPKPKSEKGEKKDRVDGKAGGSKDSAAGGDEKKEKEKEKEKVKPVTGDEAAHLVLEYLTLLNRPFSATEVSANLHGKVTKTVADKILKELGEKKEIGMNSTKKEEKGSQFVFWALQNPADAATPEELAAMDDQISALKSSLPALKSTLKTLTTKLASLKSAPSIAELHHMVDALRAGNAAKAQKLNGFKTGGVKQVSKEEMVAVERENRYWGRKKADRKKAYLAIEDVLVDGGMGREGVREGAGVEVDD